MIITQKISTASDVRFIDISCQDFSRGANNRRKPGGSSMRRIKIYNYLLSPSNCLYQRIARNRLLLACIQILQGKHTCAQLIFARNEREFEPELGCGFERLFEPEGLITEVDDQIMTTEVAGEARSLLIHTWPERSDVDIGSAHDGFSRLVQRHHQPVLADGKADSRSGRTAKGFRKPVITPSAQNRVLSAKSAVSELECRARVVVESAHKAVVQRERYADRLQDLLHLLEVLATRLVQKFADARQLLDNRLVFRNFAVEHAQGIGDRAPLAIGVHFVFDGIERLAKGFVVAGAISETADGV